MAVSFDNIPADIRVPLFYAEVDSSVAGNFTQQNVSLLIGQKLAGGSASDDTAYLISTVDRAKELFGVGSMLARMCEVYRQNDVWTELWAMSVANGGGAAAATGDVTITGTATAAGTLTIYIAGQRVQAAVASGDNATTVGDALEAAVTALTSLPVTASNTTGVVTMTARHAGASGNKIDIRANYRGALGGESTPAGLTVAVNAMSGGTTEPDLSASIAAMGDVAYEYIGIPYTDATNLDAIGTEMNDTAGRWSPIRQLYGGVYSAREDTHAGSETFGASRNDPHVHVLAYYDWPTPPWEVAAMLTAQAAGKLNIDPARPLQTLPLVGALPPVAANEWTITERDTLLKNGLSTAYNSAGTMRLDRVITTYQTNEFSQPDVGFLDATTLATLAYILRYLKNRITTKFPRSKLADDGTRFGDAQNIVTPAVIRAELIAAYSQMESIGLVENMAAFKASLIVERDTLDANRINVLFPPDLINQLRIFAVLAQFRLQYQAAT